MIHGGFNVDALSNSSRFLTLGLFTKWDNPILIFRTRQTIEKVNSSTIKYAQSELYLIAKLYYKLNLI